jgi:PAS domain S-box-containing protein
LPRRFIVPVRSVPQSELEALRAEVEALRAENADLRAEAAAPRAPARRPSRKAGPVAATSEDWVARAFLHAPFPAIVHADDGEVLALSDGFVQSTGYRREDIRTIEDWLVRAYGERHTEVAERIRRRFHDGGVLSSAEIEVGAADGRTLRWICDSSPPERLADGRLFSVVMAADITAWHAAEAARRESESFAHRLIESSPDCIKTLDLDGRLRSMNEQGMCIMEVDHFPAVEGAYWPDFWPGESKEVAEQAVEQARKGQVAHFTGPARTLKGTLKYWDVVVSPVFDDAHRVVRLLSVSRDITVQHRALEALRESEARARLALDAGRMGTWVWDIPQDRLSTTPAIAALFGLPPEAAEGEPVARYLAAIHPDDQALAQQVMAEALASGGEHEAEYRLVQPDGGMRTVLLRGRIEYDGAGHPQRFHGVVLDVTERREAEDALRESETRARLALDAARLGTWTWDLTTDVSTFDARTAGIIGLDPDTAVHAPTVMEELLDPKARAIVEQALASAFAPGSDGRYEAEYSLCPAGQEACRWIHTTGQVFFEGDGDARRPVRMVGTLRDVTERVEAEEAVRRSEARYRSLVTVSASIVWHVNPEGRFLEPQPEWEAYTGQTWEAHRGFGWIEAIHEEDREALLAQWNHARATQTPYRAEGRLWHAASGTYRHFVARAAPITDADGAVVEWVGMVTDEEELYAAEAAAREQEAQFRALADTIPQLAWMADPSGWIFWYNARWYEYTGTTPEQMEGWGWQSVHDPEVLPHVIERWKESIENGTVFEMEFPLRGADGVLRPFLTRVAPLRDDEGRILRWFGTNTDVTAMREMAAALRASETRFRDLADAVPQIVYVSNATGEVEYLNDRWFDYTGDDREGAEARSGSFTHPDDAPRIAEGYARALRRGRPFTAELRLRRRDGRYRWHLTRVYPVRDSDDVLRWYGTSTDIEDLRQAQEALARQARLLDLSHDAIFAWQPDGGITYWNRGAEDLYGYSPAEALGKASRELLQTTYTTDPDTFMAELLERGEWFGPLQHVTKDGRRITVESRWQAVRDEGGPLIVLETARDVTARLEAEQQMRLLNAELYALNEQLEARVEARTAELQEANRVLGVRNRELQDFAYVASHDLQEPLRKIRAFSDLLVSEHHDTLGDEPRHYLTRILDAATRMSRLITDLLAFSRVTTKGEAFVVVDLNATMQAVLSDLEVSLEESGGQVAVNPEGGAPLPTVEADPVQMHQLLLNLVGNALKYRPEGVAPRVVVRSHVEPQSAVLTVSDNGIGFEPKYADRIFAPFQRLHARGEYEGTGMGLAIVRRIVERHGGSVTATSEPGRGSTFTVTLPLSLRKAGKAPPP